MPADDVRGQGAALPLVFFILLVFAAALLLRAWGPALSEAMLRLSAALLRPLALFAPGYAEAASRISALDPGTVSPSLAFAVLSKSARWYVWILGLPLGFLLFRLGSGISPAEHFRRTLGMRGLLREDMPFNPCVAPAVNWPGGILNEPLDSGPWRAGRQPLQLCAGEGLLRNGEGKRIPADELLDSTGLASPSSPWLDPSATVIFDRKRAAAYYAAAFREPWRGWENLPPYLKKLACAFVLHALDRKKEAQRLLDEMSLSFRAPVKERKASLSLRPPFFRPARRARGYVLDTHLPGGLAGRMGTLLQDPRAAAFLRPHSFWRDTALLALYEAARTKVVLPTAEFIWLRPVNRQLWYLLNNLGRRTAWPETAGLWAHYMTETAISRVDPASRGIEEPQVEEAVRALERAMYEEGWIAADQLSSPDSESPDSSFR